MGLWIGSLLTHAYAVFAFRLTHQKFRLLNAEAESFLHASCNPDKGYNSQREGGIRPHVPYFRRLGG